MKFFVGTSGWYYDWNMGKSLDWYIENSKLNAIELNMSFYRFPFPNMVKSWASKGAGLHWSIKVNRLITHMYKFNDKAIKTWIKFRKLFKPLDKHIDFYLFQTSHNFINIDKIIDFADKTKLGSKFALELRNKKILDDAKSCKRLQKKMTLVSIDSPDFHNKVFPGRIIYMRIHGRTLWYQHNYSKKELTSIADNIKRSKPSKSYVFFNNNHNMLNNARLMMIQMKSI